MKRPQKAYRGREPFIAVVVDIERKLDQELLEASWISGGKRIVPLPILDANKKAFHVPESLRNRRLRLFVPETYSQNTDAATIVCTHKGRRFRQWFRDVSDDMPPEITAWFSPDQGYTAYTVRAKTQNPRVIIRNHAMGDVQDGIIRIFVNKITDEKIGHLDKITLCRYEETIRAALDKACNRKKDLEMTEKNPLLRISYFHKTTDQASP
ncbi:MAG: hypothetical protein HGA38_00355 [Candidatus Moranbacteria bacterium]|nr:hypothetical protein [Candidatus Moranbacteria bacterium]NTW45987.1 hypothetical protein [Candidatus Moranbacteria bacterium]